MTVTTFDLHGYAVDAPFELCDRIIEVSTADLTMRLGSDAATESDDLPAGELIAHYATDRPRYALVLRPDGTLYYRFHGLLEIEISADLTDLEFHVFDGADEAMVPVIAGGNVMSAVMMMAGHGVLHASAVDLGGTVVAFPGNSGAGKSTLAAMLCSGGASLVTDDVLRVEVSDGQPTCFLGATSLRLREGSKAFLALAAAEVESADGRQLFRPASAELRRPMLSAMIFPRLLRSGSDLELTRVSSREALFGLLALPRVQNWTHAASTAAHFETFGRLVETVPAWRLDIPRLITSDAEFIGRLSEVVSDAVVADR